MRILFLLLMTLLSINVAPIQAQSQDDCPADQVEAWFQQFNTAFTAIEAVNSEYTDRGKYLEPAIVTQQQRHLLDAMERPACIANIHVKVSNYLTLLGEAFTLLAASEDVIPRRSSDLLGIPRDEMQDYAIGLVPGLPIIGDMLAIEQQTGVPVFEILQEAYPEDTSQLPLPAYPDIACSTQNIEGWLNQYQQTFLAINSIEQQYASRGQYLEPAIVLQQERRTLMTDIPNCLIPFSELTNQYLNNLSDYYTLQSAYDVVGERTTNELIGIAGYQKNVYLAQFLEDSFYFDAIDSLLFAIEGQYPVDTFALLNRQRPEVVQLTDLGDITFGEVIIARSDVENILSVETITLPNCNGLTDFSMVRHFAKESSRTISFGGESTLQTTLDVTAQYWAQVKLNVEAYIRAYFDYEGTEIISESIDLEFIAPPGETLVRDVTWVEVSTSGFIEVIRNGQIYMLEFTIPSTLRAVPSEPTYQDCE